jgi:hypothetical protein
VKPGDYCEVTVEFVAPKKAGSFCSYYKLMYGNFKSMGKKVWCDIVVTEPEDDLVRLQREMNELNMMRDSEPPKPKQEENLNNFNH